MSIACPNCPCAECRAAHDVPAGVLPALLALPPPPVFDYVGLALSGPYIEKTSDGYFVWMGPELVAVGATSEAASAALRLLSGDGCAPRWWR